jgi:hypothetical protein
LAAEPENRGRAVSAFTHQRKTLAYDFFRILYAPHLGKTPAIGDHQARGLLEAPKNVSLKDKRDRAILATMLYHALLRSGHIPDVALAFLYKCG